MTSESRYHYEKRIKNLEAENRRLERYRVVVQNIGTTIGDVIGEGKSLNPGWIIRRIMELL